MRGGIVGGEQLVEGQDRPRLDVGLPAERPRHLVERPVDLLVQPVHPVAERLSRDIVRGKVATCEFLEARRIAVLRAPEARDLRETTRDPGTLRFAVRGDELGCHLVHGRCQARVSLAGRSGQHRRGKDHEGG